MHIAKKKKILWIKMIRQTASWAKSLLHTLEKANILSIQGWLLLSSTGMIRYSTSWKRWLHWRGFFMSYWGLRSLCMGLAHTQMPPCHKPTSSSLGWMTATPILPSNQPHKGFPGRAKSQVFLKVRDFEHPTTTSYLKNKNVFLWPPYPWE